LRLQPFLPFADVAGGDLSDVELAALLVSYQPVAEALRRVRVGADRLGAAGAGLQRAVKGFDQGEVVAS